MRVREGYFRPSRLTLSFPLQLRAKSTHSAVYRKWSRAHNVNTVKLSPCCLATGWRRILEAEGAWIWGREAWHRRRGRERFAVWFHWPWCSPPQCAAACSHTYKKRTASGRRGVEEFMWPLNGLLCCLHMLPREGREKRDSVFWFSRAMLWIHTATLNNTFRLLRRRENAGCCIHHGSKSLGC